MMLIKLKTKAYLLRKASAFCIIRNSKKLQNQFCFWSFVFIILNIVEI